MRALGRLVEIAQRGESRRESKAVRMARLASEIIVTRVNVEDVTLSELIHRRERVEMLRRLARTEIPWRNEEQSISTDDVLSLTMWLSRQILLHA